MEESLKDRVISKVTPRHLSPPAKKEPHYLLLCLLSATVGNFFNFRGKRRAVVRGDVERVAQSMFIADQDLFL